MTMGNRIAKARKDKGYTQEYVAEFLGVSRQAVFKWEKDQTRPDTKNLIALTELLGVSVAYLTKGSEQNRDVVRRVSGEAYFRASLISLVLLPICWLIGVFSGEYTDMVQIPLPNGGGLGLPFLMYGHSPFAVVLVAVSLVSLLLFLILLVLGHQAYKD